MAGHLSHMSKKIAEKVQQSLIGVLSTPSQGGEVVGAVLVSHIFVSGAKVFFSLVIPEELAERMEPLRLQAQSAACQVEGVKEACVTLTSHKALAQSGAGSEAGGPKKFSSASSAAKKCEDKPVQAPPLARYVIVVASGKGGVGKSTTAINLSLALHKMGAKTGLLDADIYGPSLPRLVGLVNHKAQLAEEQLQPVQRYGLALMSMGFLVDERQPVVWRSPLVAGALHKLLYSVAWGALDFLIIDLPPGTGDIALNIAKNTKIAGAVIVTTPQDVALTDVIKSIGMFKKMQVPLVGLVDNMSYFIAPDTQKLYYLFGEGKVERAVKEFNIPLLAQMPLAPEIATQSDEGLPILLQAPESVYAKKYGEMAKKIIAFVANHAS